MSDLPVASGPGSVPTGEPRKGSRTAVQREGLVMARMWTSRTVPFELDVDRLLQVVRQVHPYRDGSPSISLDDGRITWQDGKGIIFHMRSSAGETEIHVRVSKFLLLRRGRMTRWVKEAADRVEATVRLVGSR